MVGLVSCVTKCVPKKSQPNSYNQSQKWALFKLSGCQGLGSVKFDFIKKKVKSVKKMSKTRNGKSDFGILSKKKVKSQSPGSVKLDFIKKKLNL